MEATEINVSKGVTISVGKFESVRVDAAITMRMDEGEDYDTVYSSAMEIVSGQVMAQVMLLKPVIDKGSFVHQLEEDAIVAKVKKSKSSRRRG